jgi:hypothetical protein
MQSMKTIILGNQSKVRTTLFLQIDYSEKGIIPSHTGKAIFGIPESLLQNVMAK